MSNKALNKHLKQMLLDEMLQYRTLLQQKLVPMHNVQIPARPTSHCSTHTHQRSWSNSSFSSATPKLQKHSQKSRRTSVHDIYDLSNPYYKIQIKRSPRPKVVRQPEPKAKEPIGGRYQEIKQYYQSKYLNKNNSKPLRKSFW